MSIFEKGSLSIGKYFGIPVKIHWTFGYIFFYIVYVGVRDSLGVNGAIWFGAFMLSLFLCVILHEYGHALTAKRFGIQTVDITLTPLGGLARLMRLPEKPAQELLVALAGPAVNVVIASLIYSYIKLFTPLDPIAEYLAINNFTGDINNFLIALMWVNIVLLIFNLLPVFPMDGGRVLRALIALKWSKYTATKIAARLGQLFSLGFLALGIYSGDIVLALIGVFIFQGAWMELNHTRLETQLKSGTAEEVYRMNFETLEADELVERAREFSYYSNQAVYPVTRYQSIIGCIKKSQLTGGLPIGATIESLGILKAAVMHKQSSFLDIYNAFAMEPIELVIFKDDNHLVGILDKETFFKSLVDQKILISS